MADAPPTASIPSNARARQLRACLLCSIIQSPVDFRRNGCPNCEEIMQMKQSQDRVLTCTTTHFEGVIAVIDPESSWVARWQRTAKYVRGMYARPNRPRLIRPLHIHTSPPHYSPLGTYPTSHHPLVLCLFYLLSPFPIFFRGPYFHNLYIRKH
ncbi:transcription initiation Spt4 [Pyrrhoderma noxium]|uniref:Transcription elongation factor SPT4 n=1 Tax=Pyrrhoderma noxium TaxID=2282107 RepID=A0A286ULT5_9AGAM|nr:transcription initiation Spt4 [Pyrrhoderma noxium]